MKYSVHRIETIEDFKNLKSTWDNLLQTKTSQLPYLDHAWFELWLDHFKNTHDLSVLLLKKAHIPKAICPFLIKYEKLRGVNVSKIELIGNIYSPIRNFIFADVNNSEKTLVLQAMLNALCLSVPWDIVDLPTLPEEDFDFNSLKDALKRMKLNWTEYFCFGNWYLDNIDFTGDQYIQSRTSNIRNNIKRYSKKLEKMGSLKSIMVTNGTNAEIDKFMDAYYMVYGKSWKLPEMDPTFHRDLAKLARDKGWLRLGFLFLDNTPIATQLWLVCEGVAYIAKLAYDEDYKKLIPGVILSAEMMKHVIDVDRVREVDYLEGDEPYKKDWTPKRRERKGVLIFNTSPRGKYLALMETKVLPPFRKHETLSKLKQAIKRHTS
jgi:hypothetical protein